jgi:N-acetylglucosamine malate deacetylase 1
MFNKILVIGAHYDDAELGVGGSMAKWISEGKDVFKLTLTDNETDFDKKGIKVDNDSSVLESAKACKVLGINEILDIDLAECTNLQFNKKQMQQIEGFIIDNNIDTVVMHYTSDIQQDHIHAATISYVAGRYCDNILMYQSNKYILPEAFYPRYFIDITDTVELKKKALACYGEGHNRYNSLFDITITQNRVEGYKINMNEKESYAESFIIMKMVGR